MAVSDIERDVSFVASMSQPGSGDSHRLSSVLGSEARVLSPLELSLYRWASLGPESRVQLKQAAE